MRTLLLTLTLLFLSSTANAQNPLIQLYRESQSAPVTVEQHPQANEPVDMAKLGGPLPPYLAQKYLRGEHYIQWALIWNAYHDEVANRSAKTRVLTGQTITTTQTTNGTVTNVTPRIWFQHQGSPGAIRYNPFVEPKRN